MKLFLLPVLVCLLSAGPSFGSKVTAALDAAQIGKLQSGQTVVVATDKPGMAWPELTLYRKVNAPAQVIAKMFTDYENAPNYIPGMVAAKVVRSEGDKIKDVRYTVKLPVFSTMSYTVRNFYSRNGDRFDVRWELLESPVARSSDGSLIVEPYEGGSVIRYQNLVDPSVPMAGALKGQALKEAETTVEAIATEAERMAAAQ